MRAQIFLSYGREDREKVESLYRKLSEAGFKPWMDPKDLLPGEKWDTAIQEAIQRSDFFLVCLSAYSIDKKGWFQKEIQLALDVWQEKADRAIYLIPVRLEDCEVPEVLHTFQWINLFEEDGWTQLVKAIKVGTERLKPPTFESLRQRHTEFMEEMAAVEDRSTLAPEVEAFILETRKAGTHIARSEERDILKGILNFWAGFVFEQTGEYPDTDLYPSEQPVTYQQQTIRIPVTSVDVESGEVFIQSAQVAPPPPARRVDILTVFLVVVSLLILTASVWNALQRAGPPPVPAVMMAAGPEVVTGPARPGEMLVILARFEGAGPFGPIVDGDQVQAQMQAQVDIQALEAEKWEEDNPATVLLKEVQKRLSQADAEEIENQRFWLYSEVITTTRRALDIGELNGATLVVWGKFEGSDITVNFQTVKDRSAELTAETRALENVLPICSLRADVGQGGLAYLTDAVLGQLYYWAGRYNTAHKLLTAALQNVPEMAVGTWGEEDLYFYLGLANLDAPTPDYDAAMAQYSQAIDIYKVKTQEGVACTSPQTTTVQICSRLGGAYNNRGLANAALKRYEDALESYTAALSIVVSAAHLYQAHNNLAIVYEAKGQQEQAEEEYRVAAAANWPQVYQNWGNSYFHYGDYQGAVAAYSQVITLTARFALTYMNRGNAHFNLGNEYREAAEENKALEHYSKALEDYSRVIELAPDHAEAYYSRGTVYKLLGEREKAMGDFAQYLDLAPDGPGRLQAEAYLRKRPPGEGIVFVSDRDGYWAIYEMNNDGTNQVRLSDGTTDDQHPATSPAGNRIVYVASPIVTDTSASRGRAGTDLYIMNLIDNTRKPFAGSYLTDDGDPSWSPDEKWIVCNSYQWNNDGQYIHVLNSKNGARQVLLEELTDVSSPAWSPGGNKIAFASTRRGNWDIYVMEVEVEETRGREQVKAGKVYTLTFNPADDWAPAWSPDGKWLAFTSNRDGNPEIYVVNSKGGELRRLTNNPAGDYQPSWSSDGRVVFYSDRDGNREIYVMGGEGTDQTRLTYNEYEDISPVWTTRYK